jgi:hypothetical protein
MFAAEEIQMKMHLVVTLLITVFIAPLAHAYGGIIYGQVEAEDAEVGNLGLVIGDVSTTGFGVEGFFSFTVDKDTASDPDSELSIDAFGIMGVYRSPGPAYFKVKAGVAQIELEVDFSDFSNINEEESGLAYGIAVGTSIGSGALELSYTVLPKIEKIEDFEVDVDVDMIALTYLWGF